MLMWQLVLDPAPEGHWLEVNLGDGVAFGSIGKWSGTGEGQCSGKN